MNTLLKRSLSGALFLVVLVGGLLLSPFSFAALMAFVVESATIEYYRMTIGSRRYIKEMVCVCLCQLMVFSGCFIRYQVDAQAGSMLLAAGLVAVFAAFALMLFDCRHDHDLDAHLFFPLVYVLPAACASTVLCYGITGQYNPWLVLGLFILAWSNDVFAYIFGMSFGQRPGSRKLAPDLSPKKSWIGVIGGTFFTFLAAAVVWLLFGFGFFRLCHWMAVAAIVSVFGVLGDLFESLIKRHAAVKDAGDIIPGHGGVLDRFDDILFIFPLTAIYLYLASIL